MRYKTITLNNRREYSVDPEVYPVIVQMVLGALVCSCCGGPYTKLHPQVMQNTCLDCYFREYSNDDLTYLGLLRVSADGDETHYFRDRRGMIHTSMSSQKDKPSASEVETLRSYHFQVPKEGEYKGQKIEFSPYHWHLHGEVAQDSVLILEWSHNNFPEYGEHVFICYKDGETEPFNKRKGDHRRLYQQAKEQMEASRPGPYGDYIVRGRHVEGMWESCIYEVVSEIASAAYCTQHGLME